MATFKCFSSTLQMFFHFLVFILFLTKFCELVFCPVAVLFGELTQFLQLDCSKSFSYGVWSNMWSLLLYKLCRTNLGCFCRCGVKNICSLMETVVSVGLYQMYQHVNTRSFNIPTLMLRMLLSLALFVISLHCTSVTGVANFKKYLFGF